MDDATRRSLEAVVAEVEAERATSEVGSHLLIPDTPRIGPQCGSQSALDRDAARSGVFAPSV